jgi:hypothetical protein
MDKWQISLYSNPGFYPDQSIVCEISGSHGSEYEGNKSFVLLHRVVW